MRNSLKIAALGLLAWTISFTPAAATKCTDASGATVECVVPLNNGLPVSSGNPLPVTGGGGGGGSVTQGTVPWVDDITQWANTVLGAATAVGTETSGNAPTVNAHVTNTPAVTQSGGPWTINLTQVDGATLGAPSAYGTSPGAVTVPGVNAFVTNTNANGAAAAASSAPVTPANQPVGSANFAATQVSCASTATSIVSARTGVSGTGRISETITNTTTTVIYVGGSGVTTSTGQYLPGVAGASLTLNTTAAVYCIVATGTATVSSLENY